MKRSAFVALAAAGLSVAALPSHRVMTADDLRVRLETLSADSMQGRLTGSNGMDRALRYIAGELQRTGASPSGDSGTFFQRVPMRRTQLDPERSVLRFAHHSAQAVKNGKGSNQMVGHTAPILGFLPIMGAFGMETPRNVKAPLPEIHSDFAVLGRLGSRDLRMPRNVVRATAFFAPLGPDSVPTFDLFAFRDELKKRSFDEVILVGTLGLMPRSVVNRLTGPQYWLADRAASLPKLPPIIAVTPGWLDNATRNTSVSIATGDRPGSDGESMQFGYESRDVPFESPPRNIVAVIRGSDPELRNEYVVLSAHVDGRGIADSAERVGRDSVFHGANDATGAVALLAIAEHLIAAPIKPKRSVLLLWTVGNDQGFLGAEYFADHPTVSRDRVVANITLDDIGRRQSRPGGGSGGLLEVHTAPSVPSALIAAFEAVNLMRQPAFDLDHRAHDVAVCGGTDWHFARYGIPSARLSTGLTRERGTVRDDVATIDFTTLAGVVNVAENAAVEVANRIGRLPIDPAQRNPSRACIAF